MSTGSSWALDATRVRMATGSHGRQAGKGHQRQWPAMGPGVARGQGLTPGRQLEPCQNSGHGMAVACSLSKPV